MWGHAIKGLSSRFGNPLRFSRWTQKLKKHIETEAKDYARSDFKSQWIFKRLRYVLNRHARKGFALSAAGVYNAGKDGEETFDWKDCNIDDRVLKKLSEEMKEIETLKMATIICGDCNKRLLINKAIKGKEYCSCPNNKATADANSRWQPFLEDEDIIIWRREQTPGEGQYSYKVYGCYKEISAEDFLAMNLDTDYWRSWDLTAVSLQVLEAAKDGYGGQCVMHWEMEWPKFFSNRDYVYVRKYAFMDGNNGKKIRFTPHFNNCDLKDNNSRAVDNLYAHKNYQKMIVISSRSCEHPNAPEVPSVHRVKQYWSNMVIKPFSDYDKPGIEFSLTYFDDPGTNMPSTLQSWVAGYGMPDYLDRMRKAAAAYKGVKGINNSKPTSPPEVDNKKYFHIPENIISKDDLIMLSKKVTINEVEHTQENDINDNKNEPQDSTAEFLNLITEEKKDSVDHSTEEILKTTNNVENLYKSTNEALINNTDNNKEKADQETSVESQEKNSNQNQYNRYNYWHLWPLYYFA